MKVSKLVENLKWISHAHTAWLLGYCAGILFADPFYEEIESVGAGGGSCIPCDAVKHYL
jgi:hypothetical protein